MDLTNKVAVVTGVSKGIGYHTALQLLNKGALVFGLGRSSAIQHPNYTFITCDVRDAHAVEQAFAQVLSLTQNQIHVLVNNAGLGYFGMLENTTYEQWDEMFQTNVNGIFYFQGIVI